MLYSSKILSSVLTLALGIVSAAASAPASAAPSAFITNERAVNVPHISVDATKANQLAKLVKNAVVHAAPVRGRALTPIGPAVIRGASANSLVNHGGPVVQSATLYNLYVNSAPATFGYPGSFISDSSFNGADQFFHATDQYVGTNAASRYVYGGYIEPSYNTTSTLHDADIYNLVMSGSNAFGGVSGYNVIFNVFLPPGVTECSTSAGGCYGTAPWTFCAYHGSFNFWSWNGFTWTLKHALYSVEPFQQVNGCNAPSNNLSDDTVSTMSHELSETITDPDLNAWWGSGGEIGDLCRWTYSDLYVGTSGSFFNRTFNMQQEWLNDAANGAGGCGY